MQDQEMESVRSALVIAHPGHELRVHGWLERARPRVFVLTDGSGQGGRSRLPSTARILEAAGAVPGAIHGRLTDAAAYRAMLDGDGGLFAGLARELAAEIVEHGIERVAGDACEGYNPTHDVCRFLIDAAVLLARRASARPIATYDFPLDGRPDACPEGLRERALWLRLDDRAFARKVATARAYPELAGELEAVVRAVGAEAFRVECLRPVEPAARDQAPPADPPFYERHGEKQVAAGIYGSVLRWREHLRPIAEGLRELALSGALRGP